MDLGELEFMPEDFEALRLWFKGQHALQWEDGEKIIVGIKSLSSGIANRILREKLAKAKEVLHTLELPGWRNQLSLSYEWPNPRVTHTARLVCIEEIK